jgi:hypothetical protein
VAIDRAPFDTISDKLYASRGWNLISAAAGLSGAGCLIA